MYSFIEQIYKKNKRYKKIVFLDRDGTINTEVNYLYKLEQIEIIPKVSEGIKLLSSKNICVVVITNQPVVARGLVTISELKEINDTIAELLKKEGAFIDAIYSCPHHPERNHSDIPNFALKYRIRCECRKPGLAMYKRAIEVYGVENILGVIGDRTSDILAGNRLGVKSVIVKTGYKGKDGKYNVAPDIVCENLFDAVTALLV